FGLSRVMDADFNPRSSSAYDWETRFDAYRWDEETGFYQVRYRYLHPNLGRWISRDPAEEDGGLNLFALSNNNVVNNVDYLGLVPALIAKDVAAPKGDNCGAFVWQIFWQLQNGPHARGYVVQNVAVSFDVKHCDGTAYDVNKEGGINPAAWPLWEAWPVSMDQSQTDLQRHSHKPFDDQFSFSSFGTKTCGTVTITASAAFYELDNLPRGQFRVTNQYPTGSLLTTKNDPHLTGGGPAAARTLTAKWSCCDKDEVTSLTVT
ncbi:MAG: hypothetical protein EBS84_20185, partial [Proteobacteria bacterium]|nr:hypothetical protein [Verrucomicrobiota bacterium]NBU11300.1 hypothetical protein [Pseudomonadota bacterium]